MRSKDRGCIRFFVPSEIRAIFSLCVAGLFCLAHGSATAQSLDPAPGDGDVTPGLLDLLKAFGAGQRSSEETRWPGPQPLPSGADAVTSTSRNATVRKWYEAMMIANYRKHGHRDEKWDARVERFLAMYVPFVAGTFDGGAHESVESLGEKGDQIAALGCADPLFELNCAQVALHCRAYQEAMARFERARPALISRHYPAFFSFLAVKGIQVSLSNLGESSKMGKLDHELLTWAVKAAGDADFGSGNQRQYLEECLKQGCVSAASRRTGASVYSDVAMESYIASNNIDPWIANVVRGENHIDQAWDARGGGWAYTVTEDGWKGFGENLDEARKYLTDAYRLHPEFPEAASRMITVSMGSCRAGGEERVWFDRAVAAQFDYATAYHCFAWAIRPRWGGSHKQMLAFARECLATKRFDTRVPLRYCETVIGIASEYEEDWKTVFTWPGVYDDWVAVTAGYLASDKYWNDVCFHKSRMAFVAWATGRYEHADRLFRELEGAPRRDFCERFSLDADEVVGETGIRVGPHASDLSGAEALAAQGRFDEAAGMLDAVAGDATLDPKGRWFARGRSATFRTQLALNRNEWVDATPPPDMVGWQRTHGDWVVSTNGTLVGSRSDPGYVWITWNAAPGKNVELECEMESDWKSPASYSTIVLAYKAYVMNGVGIQVAPNGLYFKNCFRCKGRTVSQFAKARTQKVRVLLWDGRLTAYVNGKKIARRIAIDADWIGGPGLAFFEYIDKKSRHEARYRNIRVRRLKDIPADF